MRMDAKQEVLLRLDGVGRVYPRDVSDTHLSVLREMFLPLRALGTCPPTHFHALRDITISLTRGQKSGVLGLHRSGKSTLAGIAAGLMQPTSGVVSARAPRSLIARPTAGFKPGLTVIENLSFRAMLHGLTGEALHSAVERTLSLCGVSQEQAERAIGNLSPHMAKQLGMSLLLELPAEVLVIDELSGAGAGAGRWETRGRLQDRMESGTALLISSDVGFMRDTVDHAWVLHQARLYGPFEVEQAIEAFSQLPAEGVGDEVGAEAFDPMRPPRARATGGAVANSAGYDFDTDEHEGDPEVDEEWAVEAIRSKSPSAPWRASAINVDGADFRHSRLSLVRQPGAAMQVSLELVCLANQDFTGGMFTLHGGNSGAEVGRFHYPHPPTPVRTGERMTLAFEFVVPDWGEDFYGLTFCPQTRGKHFAPEHRIKILIFGVGRKHDVRPDRILEIRNSSFERKLDDASVNAPPEGQQATGQMVTQVRAAA